MADFGAIRFDIELAAKTLFPNKFFLTTAEAAQILDVNPKTIRKFANRAKNPLPVVWFAKNRYKIPVEGLCRWCANYGMVRGLWR